MTSSLKPVEECRRLPRFPWRWFTRALYLGTAIRKVMGGGGGEFSSLRNFFRYLIPCMNFFQAIAWIFFRINWRARIFFIAQKIFLVLGPPPISFLMVRPLVLRKSRTLSRQHLSQLKRSLYLCEDTVGIHFIHFSMSLSTLSLAAWSSLVRWFWHLSLWTIDNSRSYGVTIQMKATEQFFPMLLFIIMYKVTVVLPFQFLGEILWCDHSNESYWTVLSQYNTNCVFCTLQNEILNSSRILTWPFLGVNGQWVNGGNGIWNSANLFFGLTRFCCRHRRNKLPY